MYKGKSTTTFIITLLIVLIVGMGAYIISGNNSLQEEKIDTASQENTSNNTQNIPSEQTIENSRTSSDTKLVSCISELDMEVKKDKIAYEKGSILVTFAQSSSQTQASAILSKFDVQLQNEGDWSTYGEKKWFVVSVPRGEEFRYVCLLKLDNQVAYVGLNQTFDLHL